jgi:CRISPR-associated protein Csd1
MILQALVNYYDRRVTDPDSEIAPFGLEKKDLKFIIEIDENGKFINLIDLRGSDKKGKYYLLPRSEGRSGTNSWQTAFLLWDHWGYVLGCPKSDTEKEKLRAAQQKETFIKKIISLPDIIKNDKGVAAVIKFYEAGQESEVMKHSNWPECRKINGCNISFKLNSDTILVPEREVVKNWVIENAKASSSNEDKIIGRCLVSGEIGEIKKTHTKFSIGGNQAALVACQKNSGYDSYGKEQAYNAPVSVKSEFAYSTALKSLLESEHNKTYINDLILLFWAQPKTLTAEETKEIEEKFLFLISTPYVENQNNTNNGIEAVKNLFESIKTGKMPVDMGDKFYVLGISSNVARIVVRLWKSGSISDFSEKIIDYFNDMEIDRSPKDPPYLTFKEMLSSVAIDYKIDKLPPNLSGSVLMSILNGMPYPATFFQHAIRRIRAERKVPRARAAIIKAYINRLAKRCQDKSKEVTMSLDKSNTDAAYRLGRLFAVLEKIQEEANPGLNSTIRERFYGAMSSTPLTVLPMLMRLKNHHLAKLDNVARKNYFEKEIGEIMEEIQIETLPKHFSLVKQGYFAVGYYHQRQMFFTKQNKNTD